MRNFLEEMGRAWQLGKMVSGSRSPARPAFIWPPPLSRTITVMVWWWGLGWEMETGFLCVFLGV